MSKEIPLTKSKVAVVDDEDYEFLSQWKWHLHSHGYAVTHSRLNGKNKTIYMHRLITNCPQELVCDHIDKNKLNNQKSNLRECTQAENLLNRSNDSDSISQFKNVAWKKDVGMWQVLVKNKDRHEYIGYFTDKNAAANAVNYYIKMYHGQFACLNECPFMEKEEWEKFKHEPVTYSKYRGVTWNKNRNLWKGTIQKDGTTIHLGYYSNEDACAIAYNEKAKELYGNEAQLNEVEYFHNWKSCHVKREKLSNYVGVSFDKASKKWFAQKRYKDKRLHFGYFDSEVDAANAYNQEMSKLFGENYKQNIIERGEMSGR